MSVARQHDPSAATGVDGVAGDRSPRTPDLAGRGCWFFDLDGTLVDSAPAHEEAFLATLRALLPAALPLFSYAASRGMATRDVFAGLGVSEPVTLAALVHRKQEEYRASVAAGRVRTLPGGRELLTDLVAHGCAPYLVTAGSGGSVAAALRACGLAGFFDGVLTGDAVTRAKPAADIYLLARRRFCSDRDHVIAVEDSGCGIAAAQAAGLDTVAVHATPAPPQVAAFADLGALHRELRAAWRRATRGAAAPDRRRGAAGRACDSRCADG